MEPFSSLQPTPSKYLYKFLTSYTASYIQLLGLLSSLSYLLTPPSNVLTSYRFFIFTEAVGNWSLRRISNQKTKDKYIFCGACLKIFFTVCFYKVIFETVAVFFYYQVFIFIHFHVSKNDLKNCHGESLDTFPVKRLRRQGETININC